jgi:hypothetical protein
MRIVIVSLLVKKLYYRRSSMKDYESAGPKAPQLFSTRFGKGYQTMVVEPGMNHVTDTLVTHEGDGRPDRESVQHYDIVGNLGTNAVTAVLNPHESAEADIQPHAEAVVLSVAPTLDTQTSEAA